MKKLFYTLLTFFIATLFLTSCSTTKTAINHQPIEIQKFNRDEYVVLDQINGKANSTRVWFLFIPFGGKSDQKLYEKAYNSAVKSAIGQKADGILQPRYTYKKTTIPLILLNFTTKKVTVEGKAFRIKSEEEYQNSKTDKKTNN